LPCHLEWVGTGRSGSCHLLQRRTLQVLPLCVLRPLLLLLLLRLLQLLMP
jgi:hypothetical protein